jgi:hypothetical protein
MNYHDGSPARLGDIVAVRLADRTAKARVVLLGNTREHLDVDAKFIEAESEKLRGLDGRDG